MLWVSAVITALGLVATVVSWVLALVPAPPNSSYMDWYRALLSPINKWMVSASGSANSDFNLVLMIAGPIVLLSGAWYLGENIADRVRFEKLMKTDKKSDFAKNRKDLEDLARDLPDSYRKRIKEKEKVFTGAR
jgi:hypothetical protein